MLPAVVKNKIEQIWLDVIAGGVSQPTEVIEQLTYLMFAKQLDECEACLLYTSPSPRDCS